MSVPACGVNCVSAGQGGSENISWGGGAHGACCAGAGGGWALACDEEMLVFSGILCVGAVVSIVHAWPAGRDGHLEVCRAGNTLVAYVRALGCASEARAGGWGLRHKRAVHAAGSSAAHAIMMTHT
jgi:hypothetical protein